MFRFTGEPSSGSHEQCLAKVTSLVQLCMSVQSLVLWRHILTWCACLYTHAQQVGILAKHLQLADDGSYVKGNMLERLLYV